MVQMGREMGRRNKIKRRRKCTAVGWEVWNTSRTGLEDRVKASSHEVII